MQGDTSAWDTKLNGVGTTNLRIKTSNGYSPHLYPEYITDIEYYYGAAPRPGFMGRFIVGESNVARALLGGQPEQLRRPDRRLAQR